MPGIQQAVADMGASSVQLTFNTTIITLAAIQKNIGQYGYEAPPALAQTPDRVGSRIVIPPNGVV
jgi:hypothetical protein